MNNKCNQHRTHRKEKNESNGIRLLLLVFLACCKKKSKLFHFFCVTISRNITFYVIEEKPKAKTQLKPKHRRHNKNGSYIFVVGWIKNYINLKSYTL